MVFDTLIIENELVPSFTYIGECITGMEIVIIGPLLLAAPKDSTLWRYLFNIQKARKEESLGK
jgi:hypothetical protein